MSFGLKLTALACLLSPLAVACGSSNESVTQHSASLTRAASCEDLTQLLRADAIARVRETARQLRTGDAWGGGRGGGIDDSFNGAPTTGEASGSGNAPPAAGPNGHSDTNNQVAGVDEADIVKTDGEQLWLLHGQELMVIAAWPPQSIAVEQSLTIEGSPYEMFVDGGKALVFSSTYANFPGETSAGGGGGGSGTSGGSAQPGRSEGDVAGPSGPYEQPYGTSLTKLTVVDLEGAAPRVERELYFEGSYTSSRRIGSTVRAVVSGGYDDMPVEYWDMPYQSSTRSSYLSDISAWEIRTISAIKRRALDSWLPRSFAGDAGKLTPIAPSCDDYYVPTPGASGQGMTRVLTLDLKSPDALSQTAIVGYANQLYSNSDALILAQNEYSPGFFDSSGERTSLHVFSLDGGSMRYQASGLVPGHLDDQFSIDEQGGVVRVATTSWGNEWGETDNRVLALRADAGALRVTGDSGSMAPGEQIFSARFVGDRAYVVTFRQTDPLFVVDLSDPNQLKVLGELHIPGFSDYMHPLDADHLVTIGRNRADDGVSEDALALQIFDVSQPTQPKLAHKAVFSQEGWSSANYDHKAFTFFADRQLLAFPFSGYSERGYEASLEVFHVDAESGFRRIGAADHAGMANCPDPAESCEYYYGNEVRRGVFIDEYVYSISDGGILVHALSDMSTPVGRLPLPYSYGYGGGYPEQGGF